MATSPGSQVGWGVRWEIVTSPECAARISPPMAPNFMSPQRLNEQLNEERTMSACQRRLNICP